MEVSNPTVSEIREWAYSNTDWPDSEWPLYLSWTRQIELFIELATDHKCPKKDFFRYMLYNMVGIAYKMPSKAEQNEEIQFLISKGQRKHIDFYADVPRAKNDVQQFHVAIYPIENDYVVLVRIL